MPKNESDSIKNLPSSKFIGPEPTFSKSAFQIHHLILLALGLLILGGNIIWSLLDRVPPTWDESAHLHITFKYWKALTSGPDVWWNNVLSVEPFYPPLYHLSLVPFLLRFNFSADSAPALNSIYTIITMLAVYGIGRKILNWQTGLMAAFLISINPYLSFISRHVLIESMLTAVVALSYYLYIHSNNFKDKTFTFLFSISIATGMLVKWTFMFFLFPAVILGLFSGNNSSNKWFLQGLFYIGMILTTIILPFGIWIFEKWFFWVLLFLEFAFVRFLVKSFSTVDIPKIKIFNLLIMIGLGFLICFPWYSHTLLNLVSGSRKSNIMGIREGDPNSGLEQWLYYIQAIDFQLGSAMAVVFFFSFFLFFLRQNSFKTTLIGWVLVPYIIHSLLINKNVRYILPVMPAIAVMIACFLNQIRVLDLKKIICRGVIVIGVLAFGLTGYVSLPESLVNLRWQSILLGERNLPNNASWPIDQVLDDIVEEYSPEKNKLITVRTLTNNKFFNRGLFRNSAEIRKLPIVMKSVKRNVGEMTDFFITKSGDFGFHAYKDINPKKMRLLTAPALTRNFPLFRRYSLPDGSFGEVYKREIAPAEEIQGVDNLEEVGKKLVDALGRYPIYGFKDGINIKVDIMPTDNPDDLYLGRYKKIKFSADSVVTNKIKVHDFELEFQNIQVNIRDLFLDENFILFDLERIVPKGTIKFIDLEQIANKSMRGKGRVRLSRDGDWITINATYGLKGLPIKGQAVFKFNLIHGDKIVPTLKSLNLGPTLIPEVFYRRILSREISLVPTRSWPLFTEINSIEVNEAYLKIN